ncbi:hypothetical protein PCC8801_3239 [Rippkaea orientalis PCC 8801]|uniref:Uncharacterized protein n=1 Tax=Rippkaea orientalis (strain PCC 8801 / RF-1) TaxID=41431 RepID=B7JYB2_RIPO1|nr:hypothetical protein [Rippkaea orientalis]ACK67214.1 hypothetical protein PCC8801_3239 [Rippkaea orientalis PCC 8801]
MIYYEIIKSINFIFSDFCRCLSEALSFVWCHSDSIRNLVTSAGIIAAGCWFYQKRQQLPRANLTHKIIHKELDQDTLLVHVTVTVENIGNVLINIEHADIRVHWVAPLTDQLEQIINKAENQNLETLSYFCALVFVKGTKILALSLLWLILSQDFPLEIGFPLIDSKELNRNNNNTINIEPGETHNIDCDFIFKRENLVLKVTTIMIYCYIRNVKSKNRRLGWSFEEFYQLDT